jgi:hypothetical protein
MNTSFALLVCLLAILLVVVAVRSAKRHAASTDWNTLLGRLAQVDRVTISRIAHTDEERELNSAEEESEAWFGEVGWRGFEDLQNNCAVMIDMAHYIQSEYPEAVMVAEQLRLTARQIEWHVNRIRLASEAGHIEACFTEYGSRAICLYYGMTETLKVLYRGLGMPGSERLEILL